MYIRSFAITVALAVGLLVILALAFIMCIPAYLLNFANLKQPELRRTPALPGGRLLRS